MLSKEDNEILTRVGPGTLMGNLMRRYWMPALLSLEVPEPDGPPVRVRILGEDLVGFRETNGTVGLFANSCPHRGASMFFGRNEDSGLRCVYHGWKFDASGACVDMPSEPAESNFKSKVRIGSYPTHEWNGYVWAYMGPLETLKPFREFGLTLPPERWPTSRVLSECNWVQALEGDIDSSHISYLHRNLVDLHMEPDETDSPGVSSEHMSLFMRGYDRAPSVEIEDTWYGLRYAGIRRTPKGNLHVRLTPFIMPFTTQIASSPGMGMFGFHNFVPRDDHTCWRENLGVGRGPGAGPRPAGPLNVPSGGIAPTNQNSGNDFLIDRDRQRLETYTGILGVGQQDMAITESMGMIYERGQEHLGTTDRSIIRVRRLLINAAKNLAKGIEPPGTDPSMNLDTIHATERIIAPTDDWRKLGTTEDPVVLSWHSHRRRLSVRTLSFLMYTAVFIHKVLPQHVDAYIENMRICAEQSNREPGCIRYEVTQDLADPTIMCLFQVWESDEAYRAHQIAEHHKVWMEMSTPWRDKSLQDGHRMTFITPPPTKLN